MKNDSDTPAASWCSKSKTKIELAIICCILVFNLANAQTTYWVTKTGSDSNNCTNTSNDACLTIQKGISILASGDTLNVGAGIYTDDGGASSYAPADTFCGWSDSNPPSANVCINMAGTPGSPIIIQATPGEEGQVTIDGQHDRIAIHLQNSDYIHIRGFNLVNSRSRAIASWGKGTSPVIDMTKLSIGVVIENNNIQNTKGLHGANTNGISMWGSQNWIVRNNYINSVEELDSKGSFSRLGTGIQAYGVINALVENNFIENVGAGIFWKDHYLADLATREPVFESEIRYNTIHASGRPVSIGIRGANLTEAGENYVHHNVLYGLEDGESAVTVAMAGAFGQSAEIRIENNLIDGEWNTNGDAIDIDASEDISITGNIIIRTSADVIYTLFNTVKKPVLNESNYNIYSGASFKIIADRYNSTHPTQAFDNLSAWQSKLASEVVSLNVDNPDGNSINQDMTAFFVDIANKDYRNAPGSPAIGFMPDGTNAGPYQTGNEIVGLLPNWPQYNNMLFSNSFE